MLKGDKNTCVVNDDVAGLSGSLGANHAGARDDLADQGVLLLGNVHLNIGLIPVAGPHMKRFRSFIIFALFSTRTRVSEAKGVELMLTAWPRGNRGLRHREGWGPRGQSRQHRRRELWG
jgi:hypothetical protein